MSETLSILELAKRVLERNKNEKLSEIFVKQKQEKVKHLVKHKDSTKAYRDGYKGFISETSNETCQNMGYIEVTKNTKSLLKVNSEDSKNCSVKNKIKSFLKDSTNEELQSLYDLFEERTGVIEYDGGYCKEVAEKLALEEIRRLCIAKTKGMNDKGLIPTGMSDKDGLPIKVKVSDDITRIEENTEKYPPYLKEKIIVKGIDLESQQIKDFLKKKY